MSEWKYFYIFMTAVVLSFAFGMVASECSRSDATIKRACIEKMGNPDCLPYPAREKKP